MKKSVAQQFLDIVQSFLQALRIFIYDYLVVAKYTEFMNKVFLETIDDKSSILDIGIGTGLSMINNHLLLQKKQLSIDGIDIDPDYVHACQENIEKKKLNDRLTVNKINIYNYETSKKYDYVLFSDSYAVIPNVHLMIEHCKKYLKPNGKIVVLTTLEDDVTVMKLFVKPRLLYVTLCDFGKVTSKAEFVYKIEHENKLEVDEISCIYQRAIPVYGEIKSYMVKLALPLDN